MNVCNGYDDKFYTSREHNTPSECCMNESIIFILLIVLMSDNYAQIIVQQSVVSMSHKKYAQNLLTSGFKLSDLFNS